MKKIYKLLCAVVVLALSSCDKPFVKEYGLELDSETFSTTCVARNFPLYVYCSSDWTASTQDEWISFDKGTASGHGISMVGVNLAFNPGEARSGQITVKSGKLEKTVTIKQSAFVPAWHFTFDKESVSVGPNGGIVTISVTTNIASTILSTLRPVASRSWINSISYYSIVSDNGVEGNDRIVHARFSFKVDKNYFSSDRNGTILPGLGDIEITEPATLTITQVQ